MNKNRSENVLVAGVIRNCQDSVKDDVFRLRSALAEFNEIHWLVIESDSEDDTLEALRELADQIDEFRFISLGSLTEKIPLRTERIAYCRNAYVNELQNNTIYSSIDLVLIADFDGVNDAITRQAISSCFNRTGWDVCTSNQEGPYYDIWALRHDAWCPNDCWQQAVFLKRYGVDYRKARFAAVSTKQITIPKNSEWIEVDSAFGGLAIYRRHALMNTEYIGSREDGTKICEHVPLHKKMKEQGMSIYINPSLINTTNTDHERHAIGCLVYEKHFIYRLKKLLVRIKSLFGRT